MRSAIYLTLGLIIASLSNQQALGQINVSTFGGGTYTQNFDTLITSGTGQSWTNNSTLAGWSLFRQPAPGTAITTYSATNGATTSGSFFSFGTEASTERALGGIGSGGAYFGSPGSGAVAGWIAVGFTNDTGASIPGANVFFDGEQWRTGGGTNPVAQTMALEYGIGATFESVSTWTPAGTSFNFTSPVVNTVTGALDGNTAANRSADLGGNLTFSLANGDTLWLRWIENNDSGNDHGLGIDNFRFTPVPEPATIFALGAVTLGGGAFLRRRFTLRGSAAEVV